MVSISIITTLAALRLLLLVSGAPTAAPIAKSANAGVAAAASTYWLSEITRQGTVAYASSDGYQVYRNVKDFGATGDGTF